MLEQADPAVIYEQLESGEHVIVTAGELHLERCLKDLRERFAKCDIQSGEVIVPYREGIIRAEEMNPPRDAQLGRGRIDVVSTSKQVTVRLSVWPLPESVTQYLIKNGGAIKRLYSEKKAEEDNALRAVPTDETDAERDAASARMEEAAAAAIEEGGTAVSMADFRKDLTAAFAEAKADQDIWQDVVQRITAFGPRRTGPNLLLDATQEGICRRFCQEGEENEADPESAEPDSNRLTPRDFSDKIAYAFQLATQQGPLCNEPMQGVAVFLESVTITNPASSDSTATVDRGNLGRLTGEIITSVRDAIRTGFLDWSPRILLAMYSVEIQASAEVLGRVYGVITRRRGRIISETLLEPSPNFTITALLPVAESFGFSDDIRKRTSGAASPQLIFEGFEMLDEDPFWVPFTEEELEDLGDTADKENVAKRYVDAVRQRKGLFVKKKVVEHGEKQKTLKR